MLPKKKVTDAEWLELIEKYLGFAKSTPPPTTQFTWSEPTMDTDDEKTCLYQPGDVLEIPPFLIKIIAKQDTFNPHVYHIDITDVDGKTVIRDLDYPSALMLEWGIMRGNFGYFPINDHDFPDNIYLMTINADPLEALMRHHQTTMLIRFEDTGPRPVGSFIVPEDVWNSIEILKSIDTAYLHSQE